MTTDEALSLLESIANSGSAFFIAEELEPSEGRISRFGGPCQIKALSRTGFSVVRFGGFMTFTFQLDIDGLKFASIDPASLDEEQTKHIPSRALTSDGLLITAPSGESLFVVGVA